jgi:hypothetical protein
VGGRIVSIHSNPVPYTYNATHYTRLPYATPSRTAAAPPRSSFPPRPLQHHQPTRPRSRSRTRGAPSAAGRRYAPSPLPPPPSPPPPPRPWRPRTQTCARHATPPFDAPVSSTRPSCTQRRSCRPLARTRRTSWRPAPRGTGRWRRRQRRLALPAACSCRSCRRRPWGRRRRRGWPVGAGSGRPWRCWLGLWGLRCVEW